MGIIEVKNLNIRYSGGEKSIVSCSFSVESGGIFGLLGPNGAGKSTIIKTLSGLLKNFDGEILISGKDIKEDDPSSKIAYVPQHLCMFGDFSVKENLEFFCSMEGVSFFDIEKKVEELLETFFLKKFENVQANRLSGGYRQMLNIAVSVIVDKPIIIFDEPTAGLDVWARRKVVDYIWSLKNNGKTIILTTHDLEEAEELCDHILILSNGVVLADGNIKKLIGEFGGDYTIKIKLKKSISIKSLKLQYGKLVEFNGERIVISVAADKVGFATKELMLRLGDAKADIEEMKVREPSLSEVFSNALTKKLKEEN